MYWVVIMHAAKKIRLFIEQRENPEQVQVLKDFVVALALGKPFNLKDLYEIDMRYFDAVIELLQDWRFDRHIPARSKLVDQLLVESALETRVDHAESGEDKPV